LAQLGIGESDLVELSISSTFLFPNFLELSLPSHLSGGDHFFLVALRHFVHAQGLSGTGF
jgi:hypothetical protein